MEKEIKVTIETNDGKKMIEFTSKEFNKTMPLIVKKYEDEKVTEYRVMSITTNKKLIMT